MKASTLALYHFDACPFCRRVRSVIDELGLAIEERDIYEDPKNLDDLLQGGGKKTVPCLRMDLDGTTKWLYESEDIIQFLRSTSFE